MTTELEIGLYIFILAGFLGYHVITRVPPLLHTPLMSATNAISGISLIGFLVVMHWIRQSGTDRHSSSAALSVVALRCFYILSAVLSILGLTGLSSPKYARKGMLLAAFGMVMAIAGTLFHPEIVNYRWITLGLAIGSVVGGSMGLRIPMTAVPQRTALSHSLGALAASLIGISEYVRHVAV